MPNPQPPHEEQPPLPDTAGVAPDDPAHSPHPASALPRSHARPAISFKSRPVGHGPPLQQQQQQPEHDPASRPGTRGGQGGHPMRSFVLSCSTETIRRHLDMFEDPDLCMEASGSPHGAALTTAAAAWAGGQRAVTPAGGSSRGSHAHAETLGRGDSRHVYSSLGFSSGAGGDDEGGGGAGMGGGQRPFMHAASASASAQHGFLQRLRTPQAGARRPSAAPHNPGNDGSVPHAAWAFSFSSSSPRSPTAAVATALQLEQQQQFRSAPQVGAGSLDLNSMQGDGSRSLGFKVVMGGGATGGLPQQQQQQQQQRQQNRRSSLEVQHSWGFPKFAAAIARARRATADVPSAAAEAAGVAALERAVAAAATERDAAEAVASDDGGAVAGAARRPGTEAGRRRASSGAAVAVQERRRASSGVSAAVAAEAVASATAAVAQQGPWQPSADAVAMLAMAGDHQARPGTTGSMGVATMLTPEEDMYHMAVNLGVIHGHGQKPSNAPPLSLAERINQAWGGGSSRRSKKEGAAEATALSASHDWGEGSLASVASLRCASAPDAAALLLRHLPPRPPTHPHSHAHPHPPSAPAASASASSSPRQNHHHHPGLAPHHSSSLGHGGGGSGAAESFPHHYAAPIRARTPSPIPSRGAAVGAGRPPAMPGRSALPTLGVSFSVLQRLAAAAADIDPQLTTGELVHSVVVPQTQALRCRYTEILSADSLGTPQFYISHSWKGCFVELVTTLRAWFACRIPRQDLDSGNVFFWLDIACINQHEGAEPPCDPAHLRGVLTSCDKTLLILDREGSCLNRTCCLWEVAVISTYDKFDKGRLVVLPTSTSWASASYAYQVLDISSSVAQTTWGVASPAKEQERRAFLKDLARPKGPLVAGGGGSSGGGGGEGGGAAAAAAAAATAGGEDAGRLLGGELRNMLLVGAKRELQRAEALGHAAPQWTVQAACAAAMLLHLRRQYSEAEDCLKQALRAVEHAPPHTFDDHEYMAVRLLLAQNHHGKDELMEADTILQELVDRYRHLSPHETYLEAMAVASLVLSEDGVGLREGVGGERMAMRLLEEVEGAYGKAHPLYSRCLLQSARLSAARHLSKQTEDCAQEVLGLCVERHPGLASALLPMLKSQRRLLRRRSFGFLRRSATKGKGERRERLGWEQEQEGDVAAGGSHALGEERGRGERHGGGGGATEKPGAEEEEEGGGEGEGALRVGRLLEVGETVLGQGHEAALLDAAAALHALAVCASTSSRVKATQVLCQRALEVRARLLLKHHPLVIESEYLQAMLLMRADRMEEAEALLMELSKKMVMTFGADHEESVSLLNELLALHRELGHDEAAAEVEHQILEIGKQLLLHPKLMDRVRVMGRLCEVLAADPHLVDRASLLLAKVLMLYREKLGNEHPLTRMTRQQLSGMAERERKRGRTVLNEAKAGEPEKFKTAEVLFKGALTILKIVHVPEEQERDVVDGLADAQFGQGRVHDARHTVRSSSHAHSHGHGHGAAAAAAAGGGGGGGGPAAAAGALGHGYGVVLQASYLRVLNSK